MARQKPGFVIAGEPDSERTKCHPACACREKKVKDLVEAAEAAFTELNTIRARDGVPYQVEFYQGRGKGLIGKASVTEEYFAEVADNLQAAIEGVKS